MSRPTIIRTVVTLCVLMPGPISVWAQAGPLDLRLGVRQFTTSEDRWISVSAFLGFGSTTWSVRPELGGSAAYGGYGGHTEILFGAHWNAARGTGFRPVLGAGYSYWDDDGPDRHSFYVRGGIRWRRASGNALGFDVRLLSSPSLYSLSNEYVSFVELSFLLSFGLGT